MGFSLHLLAPLLLSSSLANPIPLERAAPWPPEDIGILEQNAPVTTTQPAVSGKLTCDNKGAQRCLLFPIGCVPGVSCTDRLEMQRIESGPNYGDIVVSLNLHVSRTAHTLVAVPMPDLSNPNSTFLVGCSIDDQIAVVAKPDVDGVTEQLQLPWLRLISVSTTATDLECIVSASPGHVDLPVGDVAVFAGELQPEEEVRQSARIAGSLDEEREERRPEGRERESVEVQSTIHKISPPLPHEETTHSLEHTESTEPILVSVEDQRPATTEVPEKTTVAISSKANRLRLKMLHSSESSSAERSHRHSSAETTHSTHAAVHHETTSTTTTTQKTTTTTEVPEAEESTTETPTTQTPKQPTTSEAVEESEKSTTVPPPHHHAHHDGHSHEHHKEQPHHSHERASVDKEHHSVRMEPAPTTTTEKPAAFEDDKELSEEDKHLLREVEAGHVKEEGEQEETASSHADGTEHHRHATVFELTREAAQDPIGKRPSEHSHSHGSLSHGHSHELRAADDDAEEEHTTKKPVHSHSHEKEEKEKEKKEEHTTKKPVHSHSHEKEEEHTTKKPVHSHSHEKEEKEKEKKEEHTTKKPVHSHSHEKEEEHTTKKPVHSHSHEKEEKEDDERRDRKGEKKHQRRSEETEEDDEEDEDDATSSLSLMMAMIICLAPVLVR